MFKGEAAVEGYVSLSKSKIQRFSPACHDILENAPIRGMCFCPRVVYLRRTDRIRIWDQPQQIIDTHTNYHGARSMTTSND